MRVIGLIGGMSWESSAHYYRIINQEVRETLGGLHSARSLMLSVDFHEIERMQSEARWDDAGRELGAAAQALERAGADCVLLCTNTMHKVADAVQRAVRIPLLHIAQATAREVQRAGLHRIGLVGTRFTMEESFYSEPMEQAGLSVLTPDASARAEVHRVIYDELCLGRVLESSRAAYREILSELVAAGAQGIVLGCTEVMMLVRPEDASVPLFDTTTIHARAAVEFALNAAPSGTRLRS